MKVKHFQDSNGHYILLPVSAEVTLSDINSRWFESKYWQSKDRITGQSTGRNITWFIKAPEKAAKKDWVLRHYYRGGLVAKISNDNYVFNGLSKTRCYREIDLLQQMIEMGLPVPKPIAARVIKKGFFYTADLMMEKLQAIDLIVHLKQASLSIDLWKEIGTTIANFHNRGIYHADLNAHNILIDGHSKVWLIDFDRCRKRKIQSNWQMKNIDRLHRSFFKERGLDNLLHFEENDWLNLKQGYKKVIHS